MASILVIAHAGLAREFCEVAATILGTSPLPLDYIGVDWKESREAVAQKIQAFFDAATVHQQGGRPQGVAPTTDGVLVLVDLFGSTHSNLCMSHLSRPGVEVISGFNLPLLLKALRLVNTVSFEDMVAQLLAYGRTHVSLAREVK